ncbi:putative undecaprenyl-diphosphatase UppP [Leptospira inadai serovar Lyme str. 10]|uniref:Undecaprenyl-diphosphatase n=2 Tax=Leptospira inadai serovar Lyme TaxID=293084 RepID=V6HL65_9LEPT|nr:undecaprenyl-diphosphate phosphatase [Leptospira inadai]EQA37645.1 putative undecaprenyl-diphosphatase UppP [Leptospira inadai serovar Lyme str. 10]PNV72810.1 undecaprenyl-diphosphate phosphatase [Leptospira inadai serovar Lyme]
MESFLNAFVRSVIEAVTEFLPVSSTGHLFLFSSFFPFSEGGEFDDLFDIFIQSGAILSVIVLYHDRFLRHGRLSLNYLLGKEKNPEGILFVSQILVGCIPILVAGFLFKGKLDVIKARSDLLLILGSAWVSGGILILLSEIWFRKSSQIHNPEPVRLKDAILIGIFQCAALIPGVSRSAATIVTARFLKKDARHAAEFSFFLAVPVLISAGAYKLYKYRHILNGDTLPILAFGFLASFLLCILVIRWFLKYLQSHSFDAFGIYRIILGLAVLIFYKLN